MNYSKFSNKATFVLLSSMPLILWYYLTMSTFSQNNITSIVNMIFGLTWAVMHNSMYMNKNQLSKILWQMHALVGLGAIFSISNALLIGALDLLHVFTYAILYQISRKIDYRAILTLAIQLCGNVVLSGLSNLDQEHAKIISAMAIIVILLQATVPLLLYRAFFGMNYDKIIAIIVINHLIITYVSIAKFASLWYFVDMSFLHIALMSLLIIITYILHTGNNPYLLFICWIQANIVTFWTIAHISNFEMIPIVALFVQLILYFGIILYLRVPIFFTTVLPFFLSIPAIGLPIWSVYRLYDLNDDFMLILWMLQLVVYLILIIKIKSQINSGQNRSTANLKMLMIYVANLFVLAITSYYIGLLIENVSYIYLYSFISNVIIQGLILISLVFIKKTFSPWQYSDTEDSKPDVFHYVDGIIELVYLYTSVTSSITKKIRHQLYSYYDYIANISMYSTIIYIIRDSRAINIVILITLLASSLILFML